MDMFGMDLWWDTTDCLGQLKQLGVSYHYALKKIIGFPKWESNHYVCYLLEKLTFEHFLILKKLKFYRWLLNSRSPCLFVNHLYFKEMSYLKRSLDKVFNDKYQVDDLNANDFDALISRITYVQNREPSSWTREPD